MPKYIFFIIIYIIFTSMISESSVFDADKYPQVLSFNTRISSNDYPAALSSTPGIKTLLAQSIDINFALAQYRKNSPLHKILASPQKGLVLKKETFNKSSFDFFNLRDIQFSRCSGNQSRFIGASLDRCTFAGCSFKNTDFYGVEAPYSQFSNCILEGSRFDHANLFGAQFQEIDLRDVSFEGTILDDCRFNNCQLPSFLEDLFTFCNEEDTDPFSGTQSLCPNSPDAASQQKDAIEEATKDEDTDLFSDSQPLFPNSPFIPSQKQDEIINRVEEEKEWEPTPPLSLTLPILL